MKKRNVLLSGLLGIIVLLTQSVNAQIQVQNGATVNYSVSAAGGSTITSCVWSLTGGASGFVASSTLNQSVTWNSNGTGFVLSVYPVSDYSCNGASQSITVDVVAVPAVTIAWGTTSPICPLTTNQPGGGDVVTSVALTGIVPSGTWSFNYTIDGGAPITVSGLTLANEPVVNLDANLTNASNNATQSYTLAITSFTVNGTTYVPIAPTLSVTVYPTPAINAISY